MSNEPSPRPWRFEDDQYTPAIVDANGVVVAFPTSPDNRKVATDNARIIVDAVNLHEVTRNDRHQLQEANEAIALLESEREELCNAVRSLLWRASFLNGFYVGRHASGLEEAENEYGKTKALIDEIDKLVNPNPERNPKQ